MTFLRFNGDGTFPWASVVVVGVVGVPEPEPLPRLRPPLVGQVKAEQLLHQVDGQTDPGQGQGEHEELEDEAGHLQRVSRDEPRKDLPEKDDFFFAVVILFLLNL